MHSITTPKSATQFTERLTCPTCKTSFTAEATDLEVDRFKQPGTYWFDGSADDAGLVTRFFVTCPNGCDILFVQGTVPPLLQRDLLAKAWETDRAERPA